MQSPTQKTVSVAAHVAAINSGSQPVHGTYTTAAEGTDALVHRPPGPPSTPPPLELSEPGLNDALLAQIELAANAHFFAVESGREAASTLRPPMNVRRPRPPPGPPSTPPPELIATSLNDALLAQIELAANAHFTAVESGREAASTLSAIDTAAPSARRAPHPTPPRGVLWAGKVQWKGKIFKQKRPRFMWLLASGDVCLNAAKSAMAVDPNRSATIPVGAAHLHYDPDVHPTAAEFRWATPSDKVDELEFASSKERDECADAIAAAMRSVAFRPRTPPPELATPPLQLSPSSARTEPTLLDDANCGGFGAGKNPIGEPTRFALLSADIELHIRENAALQLAREADATAASTVLANDLAAARSELEMARIDATALREAHDIAHAADVEATKSARHDIMAADSLTHAADLRATVAKAKLDATVNHVAVLEKEHTLRLAEVTAVHEAAQLEAQRILDEQHTAAAENLEAAMLAEAAAMAAEVAGLEARLEAETAAMQAAHVRALDNATTELESLRTAHAEALAGHRASAEQAQSALEAKLLALTNDASASDEQLAALRLAHAEEVVGLEATLEAEAAAMQATHASALDDAATELESYRTAHAEALAGHRASAEQEQSALEAKLLALANDASASHSSALSDAASELSEYRADHAAELASHQGAAEEAQVALEAKLRVEEEKSATKHAAHAAAEEAHAAALAELAALRFTEELAGEAASDEQLAALRLAHAEDVARLEAKLEAEAAAMQATHASALDDAATELESFRTAEAMRSAKSHAEALAGHRASAEQEQSALEAKLLALANDASASHSSALSDAASELSEYRGAHAADLASHQGAAVEAQAALEAKLRVEEEKSATKHAAHAAAEEAHAAALTELADLRASYTRELAAAGERVSDADLAHAEMIAALESRFEAQLASVMDAADEAHAFALDAVNARGKNEHTEALEASAAAHATTLAAIEAKHAMEIDNLESVAKQIVDRRNDEIAALGRAHSDALRSAQREGEGALAAALHESESTLASSATEHGTVALQLERTMEDAATLRQEKLALKEEIASLSVRVEEQVKTIAHAKEDATHVEQVWVDALAAAIEEGKKRADGLASQLDAQRAARSTDVSTHAARAAEAAATHAKLLEAIETEKRVGASHVEQAESAAERRQEDALRALRDEHAALLLQAKQSAAQQRDVMASKWESKQMSARESKSEMLQRHDAALHALRDEHAAALMQAQSAAGQINEQRATALRAEHALALVRAEEKAVKVHAAALSNLRTEHAAGLTRAERAAELVHAEREATLREEHNVALQQAGDAAAQLHEGAVTLLKAQHTAALAKANANAEAGGVASAASTQELAALKVEVAALKARHANRDATDDLNTITEQKREEARIAELSALRAKHEMLSSQRAWDSEDAARAKRELELQQEEIDALKLAVAKSHADHAEAVSADVAVRQMRAVQESEHVKRRERELVAKKTEIAALKIELARLREEALEAAESKDVGGEREEMGGGASRVHLNRHGSISIAGTGLTMSPAAYNGQVQVQAAERGGDGAATREAQLMREKLAAKDEEIRALRLQAATAFRGHSQAAQSKASVETHLIAQKFELEAKHAVELQELERRLHTALTSDATRERVSELTTELFELRRERNAAKSVAATPPARRYASGRSATPLSRGGGQTNATNELLAANLASKLNKVVDELNNSLETQQDLWSRLSSSENEVKVLRTAVLSPSQTASPSTTRSPRSSPSRLRSPAVPQSPTVSNPLFGVTVEGADPRVVTAAGSNGTPVPRWLTQVKPPRPTRAALAAKSSISPIPFVLPSSPSLVNVPVQRRVTSLGYSFPLRSPSTVGRTSSSEGRVRLRMNRHGSITITPPISKGWETGR